MEHELSKEILDIMGKIQKLNYQFRPTMKIPRGEFIMLCAIEQMMNNKNREGYSELGIKVSELSEVLAASRPATSKMLNNIEDKQYIIRTMDKKDRRVVYINLTESGSLILEEHKKSAEKFISYIVDKVGYEDASELVRIFSKLYKILEQEAPIRAERVKDKSSTP